MAVTRAGRVFVRGRTRRVRTRRVFVRVILRQLRVGGVPLRADALRALSRRQRVRFLEALRGVAIIQAHARLHGAAPCDGHRRRRRRARAAEVLERQPVHGAHRPDQPAVDAREAPRHAGGAQRGAPQLERRAEGGQGVRHARQPPRQRLRPVRARPLAAQRQKVLGLSPVTPAEPVAAGAPARARPGEPRARARPRAARGHRVRRALEPAARDVRQPHTVRADGALQPQAEPARVALARARASWHFHLMVDGAHQPRLPRRQARAAARRGLVRRLIIQVGARARRARAR